MCQRSRMANNIPRCIRFLKILDLLRRKLNVYSHWVNSNVKNRINLWSDLLTNSILEMLQGRWSNDRCRDVIFRHNPRQRHLRHGYLMLLCNFLNAVDNSGGGVGFWIGSDPSVYPVRKCDEEGNGLIYPSTLLRIVSSDSGRVRRPRPRGDQGMEPTPKCWQVMNQLMVYRIKERANLEGREHFTFLFAVN